MENADRALASICQTDDGPAGSAELSLKRVNTFNRRMEMLVEKPFENIHGSQRYHRDLFRFCPRWNGINQKRYRHGEQRDGAESQGPVDTDQASDHAHRYTAESAQAESRHVEKPHEPPAQVAWREDLHDRLRRGIEGKIQNSPDK